MKVDVRRIDATRLHAHWVAYFYEVMRAGSIRGAAKALNVAPSAISRQLKEIEAVVGSPLTERGPSGLRLTAAGEVVAEHVGQVLAGLARMQGSLDELRSLRRGHVTIAATPATAPELLPQIVAGVRRTNPRITFTCDFVGSNRIADIVIAGDADVGVGFDLPGSSALRHLIEVPVPFGAVMKPDNPLTLRKTLRLYDFVDGGLSLIFPEEGIASWTTLDAAMRGGMLEVEPAIVTANRDFTVAMAQQGAGIGFLTNVGIGRELREGSVAFVPLVEPGLKPPMLAVVVSARRPPTPVGSLVAEALRAGVATLLK